MVYGMCSGCLVDAMFTETGHDEDGRTFKLYFCQKCKNYTRVYDAPKSEMKLVEPSLVTEALSASRRPEQMRMFPAARRSED